jgi:hypothetical protein
MLRGDILFRRLQQGQPVHRDKIGVRASGEAPIKTLLTAKSIVEVLAGSGLALFPAMGAILLLGSPTGSPSGIALIRIAGAALLALGIACWVARNNSQDRAAAGIVFALLFYDVAVVTILLSARYAAGVCGICLWPAVVLHSGLAVWSVLSVRNISR